MKIGCGPIDAQDQLPPGLDLQVVLFERDEVGEVATAGASIWEDIAGAGLVPNARAWDFLTIALSVVSADLGSLRQRSPDGWTRDIQLTVSVTEPQFWTNQASALIRALQFLTTDRWRVEFVGGGEPTPAVEDPYYASGDSVVLLSGGLDSLIGSIDLVARGVRPFAVSQVAHGDMEKQSFFASQVGDGLGHLQLNHNFRLPNGLERELSQRARSILFLAYGVVAATCLERYEDGDVAPLYLCENGFIAVNAPLTDARVGSLSTRTAHPAFLGVVQEVLDAAHLSVRIETPYEFKTKGEMLRDCADQAFLERHAHTSTSCGRYVRKHEHCGRCVPCLVRRAAFWAWGKKDRTGYRYENLAKKDADHAGFDDVRSVLLADQMVQARGIEALVGPHLFSRHVADENPYLGVVQRGLGELAGFLSERGVR